MTRSQIRRRPETDPPTFSTAWMILNLFILTTLAAGLIASAPLHAQEPAPSEVPATLETESAPESKAIEDADDPNPAENADKEAGATFEGDIDAGLKLLKRGDDQADQGQTTDAVLSYKQAFEQILPAMRGIPFRKPVKRDVTAREELGAFIQEELDEEIDPVQFRTEDLGFKALGLLPIEFDYKQTLVQLYSEEVAAFYDPRTGTMHLIREPGQDRAGQREPNFLDRLLGRTGGFDKSENKAVIAHEMTHALADQNFDLDALQKAVETNADRSLALTSLIEGEAMLTMMAAQAEDWDGTSTIEVPASVYRQTFGLLGPLLGLAGGQTLRSAPPILTESLTFPYLQGMVFCAQLTNDDGWDGLDQAYQRPPQSTEQILHPEKYAEQPDPPSLIDLGTLEPGGDWTEVGRNVLGEMQISVLLRLQSGRRAAAGWDGDQYVVFEAPADQKPRSEDDDIDAKQAENTPKRPQLGLVWATTWDSRDEAIEFARAYVRFQTSKLSDGAREPAVLPNDLRRLDQGRIFAVHYDGNDVLIVEGFDPETTDRLISTAREFKITPLEVDSLEGNDVERVADEAN